MTFLTIFTFYPRSPHGERHQTMPLQLRTLRSFYPRSPHGERPRPPPRCLRRRHISIHALRMESDRWCFSTMSWHLSFLSTLSAWRATRKRQKSGRSIQDFYPRSPHGERRVVYSTYMTRYMYFYPRSPHGERPGRLQHRRAFLLVISIHALRMESDNRRR